MCRVSRAISVTVGGKSRIVHFLITWWMAWCATRSRMVDMPIWGCFNTGFASSGVTCKLGALCFYSSSVLIESFVLQNPPERKTRNRWAGCKNDLPPKFRIFKCNFCLRFHFPISNNHCRSTPSTYLLHLHHLPDHSLPVHLNFTKINTRCMAAHIKKPGLLLHGFQGSGL